MTTTLKSPAWSEVCLNVRQHRDKTISRVKPPLPDLPTILPWNVTSIPSQVLSRAEVTVTETAPEALIASLSAGKLTATEVVNAFLRRAALAQSLVNCITELLPREALSRAKELDTYYNQNKKPIGPLHGLPISVKEHVGMKGMDRTAGYVSWVGRKAEDDAHVLKLLWNAGCVFYVRTTEPQSLAMSETRSNIYGTTTNPHNTTLTPGGSSGGESALLALRGSCLSVGTDLGGSVRIPAVNCGLYGLRPSTYRVPLSGVAIPYIGSEQVLPVVGPQSITLEGIKMFMKIVIDAKPWIVEPSLVPLPWRDAESHLGVRGPKKLIIGIMWSDGVVKPQPPVVRALKEIVDRLKAIPEVDVVHWKPWRHDYALEIMTHLYFPDGGNRVSEALNASDEPWEPLLKYRLTQNPHIKSHTIEEIWSWTDEREKYRAGYTHAWNAATMPPGITDEPARSIDILICPVTPGPAPQHGCSRYSGYTSQWSLLDYPALVFPVTKVDPLLDVKEEGYVAMNELDRYYYEMYEPEKFRDAPVGLQAVGRRYEDEKIVEAFEYIKGKIGLPFIDPLKIWKLDPV